LRPPARRAALGARRGRRDPAYYVDGQVSTQQTHRAWGRRGKEGGGAGGYRRFGLHDLGEPGVARVLEMRCMTVWTGRRVE
jgi:hypothetical protein